MITIVSDLHMFSHTSEYQAHIPEILLKIKNSTTLVLNGDTFDFRRSIYEKSDITTEAALNWLKPLIKENTHCEFHYVLGNHDNVQSLIEGLEKLTQEYKNFFLHHEYFKISDILFLHGDVCDGPTTSKELQMRRAKYLEIEPDTSSIRLARFITSLKLNTLTPLWHPKSVMCERILEYLKNEATQELESTKQIFFGHTHCAFTEFLYKGITFTNTGSAIVNLRWNAVTVG